MYESGDEEDRERKEEMDVPLNAAMVSHASLPTSNTIRS